MLKIRLHDFLPRREPCHVAVATLGAGHLKVVGLHTHDFHEFFVVLEGEGREIGRAGTVWPLRAGDLVLVRPRDAHCLEAVPGKNLRYINIAFPSAWWRRLLAALPGDAGALERAARSPRTRLRPSEMPRWEENGAALQQEASRRPWLLTIMGTEACEALTRPTEPPGVVLPAWLDGWLRAIAQPEQHQRDLGHLQRLAGRTPEHLARTCRRLLAASPTQLINRARIRTVQRRLAQTSEKILPLALEAGFGNVSHFIRTFRKEVGCLPSEWRRRTLVPELGSERAGPAAPGRRGEVATG